MQAFPAYPYPEQTSKLQAHMSISPCQTNLPEMINGVGLGGSGMLP